jgi:hypothetical protein
VTHGNEMTPAASSSAREPRDIVAAAAGEQLAPTALVDVAKTISGGTMFHRHHLTLLAASVAAVLSACASSKPITSVGSLSYPAAQSRSAGPAGERFTAGSPAARPVAPSATPAERSTNDPMLRLDIP